MRFESRDCIRRPSKLLSTATKQQLSLFQIETRLEKEIRTCPVMAPRHVTSARSQICLRNICGLLRGYLPRRGPGHPALLLFLASLTPRDTVQAMHSISDLTTFSRKTSGDVPPKLVVCLHILAEPSIRHSPDREHPPPWWDPKYTYSCVASARPLWYMLSTVLARAVA